jgi:hypothetical protein
MRTNARREPLTSEELEQTRIAAVAKQTDLNLPELDAQIEADSGKAKKRDDLLNRMKVAVRDADEGNLEKSITAWTDLCREVNETIAEAYRISTDPDLWELRYVRWMVRITFIRFESPMGEFFLVPQKPRKTPRAKHWYTVDEMLDMLTPGVAATIKAIGTLPIRPESLIGPKPGEQHLHVDLTGPKLVIKAELHGRPREGTRVR